MNHLPGTSGPLSLCFFSCKDHNLSSAAPVILQWATGVHVSQAWCRHREYGKQKPTCSGPNLFPPSWALLTSGVPGESLPQWSI